MIQDSTFTRKNTLFHCKHFMGILMYHLEYQTKHITTGFVSIFVNVSCHDQIRNAPSLPPFLPPSLPTSLPPFLPPSLPSLPGVRWVTFFRFESFPDQSAYGCQIWSRSVGRVKKGGIQIDKQTDRHKGALQLYIVNGHHIVLCYTYAPC